MSDEKLESQVRLINDDIAGLAEFVSRHCELDKPSESYVKSFSDHAKKRNKTLMGNVTPKPQHYPEKVRDMLLRNEEIPRFIELINNLELQNEIIANEQFLDFVATYKEFWEYVIALSYGATNIPLRPRTVLVRHAAELANDLNHQWEFGLPIAAEIAEEQRKEEEE